MTTSNCVFEQRSKKYTSLRKIHNNSFKNQARIHEHFYNICILIICEGSIQSFFAIILIISTKIRVIFVLLFPKRR